VKFKDGDMVNPDLKRFLLMPELLKGQQLEILLEDLR